jgi:anti-anti-sigma regulatory factor
LAEQIWSLLEQNRTHRVVLDLSEIDQLDDVLLKQLLWLHEQTAQHDGMMRICGLATSNQHVLAEEGLDAVFGHYRDYEAAVMGDARPTQPR